MNSIAGCHSRQLRLTALCSSCNELLAGREPLISSFKHGTHSVQHQHDVFCKKSRYASMQHISWSKHPKGNGSHWLALRAVWKVKCITKSFILLLLCCEINVLYVHCVIAQHHHGYPHCPESPSERRKISSLRSFFAFKTVMLSARK